MSIQLYAQTPFINEVSTNETATFTVDSLYPLQSIPNTPTPYYEGFMIFGDGNFVRVDTIYPQLTPYTFNHPYIKLSNQYPSIMLLVDRKTDTEPPDDRQSALVTGNSEGNEGIADITGNFGPITDKVKLTTFSSTPSSPLIPSGSPKKIALGHSHYVSSPGYYLKNNRKTAIPIAYKPEASGVILFYFNSDESTDFEHFEEIFNGTVARTILPNYYGESEIGPLLSRMKNIQAESAGTYINNHGIFNHVIRHTITDEEFSAYDNQPIVADEELRLFHLIKNDTLEENKEYYFVAAMYANKRECDSTQLVRDNLILSAYNTQMTLPCQITVDSNLLSYSGMDLLPIRHGDPDDPNGLVVESICKCDNQHQVTFKLQFCNESVTPATGATVVLNDKYDLFDCLEIQEMTPANTMDCIDQPECKNSKECKHDFKMNSQHRYCLRFPDDKTLTASKDENIACGTVTFTAFMDQNQLDRLTEQTLIDYCVLLHGGVDVKPICEANEILIDTLLNVENQVIVSEIWETRNKPCTPKKEICVCKKTPCFWCKPGVIATGVVIGTVVLFFGGRYIIRRRRRKQP